MKKFHNITKCANTNCYNLTLTYTDPLNSIQYIIRKSDFCYQTLWFNCKSSKITNFASWSDFDGHHYKYFSSNKTNVCECAKKNLAARLEKAGPNVIVIIQV